MSYLWHRSLALKPSPHPVVDTLRLPPAGIDTFEAIGLVTIEGCRLLLDDLDVLCRGHLSLSSAQTSIKNRSFLRYGCFVIFIPLLSLDGVFSDNAKE